MSARRATGLLIVTAFVATAWVAAHAQATTKPFEPTVGQAGKDVVWVPTPQALVEKMLDLAKLTPQDFLMDLGSGDGRTVITAAKRGATAQGIEYNPDMVELSKKNAAAAGVSAKANFVKADLFETDFSKATVVTMFLLPDINLRLRPKILEMKPGTRIVSNTFTMGEWKADQTADLGAGGKGSCNESWCTALLWIVPAKVQGTHKLPQGELTLKQEFQMLSGSFRTEGKTLAIADGRVRGEEISFKAGGKTYRGRVTNGKLELK
jgi:hypothetical protein